jgi:UDP-glucose 4-epimerase
VAIQNVLVTGGAGFIASNVARLLCDAGLSVTVLDNLSFGYPELVDPRCRFIQADLDDGPRLREAVRGVDAVMHLAASSIVARSYTDPMEYVRNNVLNGTRLLEAMRAADVRYLVFSSSASVYGEPERIPVREHDATRPLHLYGASKLAFECLLRGYHHAFGINSVSLRYFNAYGPGDLQEPVTRAVPRWIRSALIGQPIVLYWEGKQYRDYVFVDDVARAHIQVLGMEGFRVYNVGSGNGVLMRDMGRALQELLREPLRFIDGGQRVGDPMRLVADISRISHEVGWRPATTLKNGLAETIAFYDRTRAAWAPRMESPTPAPVLQRTTDGVVAR